MSALASTESLPVTHALAAAPLAASVSYSPHALEAAEQKRWMIWFGLPALVAAVFLGLVFGTGDEWYLGFAVASMVFDIGVLVWLAMSSDTNGVIGAPAVSHH
jgi:hypothetical protein